MSWGPSRQGKAYEDELSGMESDDSEFSQSSSVNCSLGGFGHSMDSDNSDFTHLDSESSDESFSEDTAAMEASCMLPHSGHSSEGSCDSCPFCGTSAQSQVSDAQVSDSDRSRKRRKRPEGRTDFRTGNHWRGIGYSGAWS